MQQGREKDARLKKFKNLTEIERNDVIKVGSVCGKVLGEVKCSQLIGPSIDAEDSNCDKYCCAQGFLMGYCRKDAIIDPNLINQKLPIPQVVANCQCTNDWRDANCGPDGRFLGISCPFDRSACKRSCCRDGKSGGSCKGFLKRKCDCD